MVIKLNGVPINILMTANILRLPHLVTTLS